MPVQACIAIRNSRVNFVQSRHLKLDVCNCPWQHTTTARGVCLRVGEQRGDSGDRIGYALNDVLFSSLQRHKDRHKAQA